jgi:protocatechuate 3,4-dioxygenase beta subunit
MPRLSRRDLLLKCAALGSLRIAAPLGLAESLAAFEAAEQQEPEPRRPTPWSELGPFYKRKAPSNPHLRMSADPGLPIAVSGRIFDTRGEALQGATIEIWQADHHGIYDLDGYRFRATLTSDQTGKYAFDSIMPGHYPARVCQHIHYVVTAPGHRPLTTQLYFATDPAFEGDPTRNYQCDPLILSPEIIRPVTLTGDPREIVAAVSFEVVLERL